MEIGGLVLVHQFNEGWTGGGQVDMGESTVGVWESEQGRAGGGETKRKKIWILRSHQKGHIKWLANSICYDCSFLATHGKDHVLIPHWKLLLLDAPSELVYSFQSVELGVASRMDVMRTVINGLVPVWFRFGFTVRAFLVLQFLGWALFLDKL
ncbi:hypothetical protein R6Q59_023031 [Mikania micrantha]